jgi:hypothetical protein
MVWIHTDDSLSVTIPLVVDYWVTMLVIAVASYSVGPKCACASLGYAHGSNVNGQNVGMQRGNKRREGVCG